MKAEFIFPIILIILDVCASCFYLMGNNLKMSIYWLAAAVLNAAVTF